MPVTTFYSYQTEKLVATLLKQLTASQQDSRSGFRKSTIIVPNSGMQRYLEIKIAKHFGICADIDMPYLGQFLWSQYERFTATIGMPDIRALTFTILQIFATQRTNFITNPPLHSLLQQYQHARPRYLLAKKIARLFVDYINERPEMLSDWQQGKSALQRLKLTSPHEPWQRALFTALDLYRFSRQTRQMALQQAIAAQQAGAAILDIPTTIHVFAFDWIPAMQIIDLLALGKISQVIFYTFNPSVQYWQDIVPETVKLTQTEADVKALFTVGNPLLASWGGAGKYLIATLDEGESDYLDDEIEKAEATSLLQALQHSIINFSDDDASAIEQTACFQALAQREKNEQHHSISLHVAASARREVEILHDYLCHLFDHSEACPADVVVMMPELANYAPHIQAIFSRYQGSNHIPYALAHQSAATGDANIRAFLSLLTLIESNFQAQQCFACLSEPAIAKTLRLSDKTLSNWRRWLLKSRYAVNYFDNSQGQGSSLIKLLDQLLLAHIGDRTTKLGNRQAADYYEVHQIDELALFCTTIGRFQAFADLAKQQQSLSTWFSIFRQLIGTFLPTGGEALIDALNQWHDELSTASQDLASTAWQQPYDFITIITDLRDYLQGDTLHGPFLSGSVTFCAMKPLRLIPADIICVLGLNDDYPQKNHRDTLDLRQLQAFASDRDMAQEQRYDFLQVLLTARQHLYLSYVGIDDRTAKTIPPSALVRDLCSYIDAYVPEHSQHFTVTYPLQGFMADRQQSYQPIYDSPPASAHAVPIHQDDFDTQTQTPLSQHLSAKSMAMALVTPLAFYWRYQLRIAWLDEVPSPLQTHEFITIDSPLSAWQYKDSALRSRLTKGHQASSMRSSLQAQNLLAANAVDHALRADFDEKTSVLSEALQHWLNETSMERAKTSQLSHMFRSDLWHLSFQGYLNPVKGSLWHYSFSQKKVKPLLQAWISHVLLHVKSDETLGNINTSHQFFDDKNRQGPVVEHYCLQAIKDKATAMRYLDNILAFIAIITAKPYPSELTMTRKKDTLIARYEAVDYPLYVLTAPTSQELSTLTTAFAPIASALNEHLRILS